MVKIEFSLKYEYKVYTDKEIEEMKSIYNNVSSLARIGEINKCLQIVSTSLYNKYPLIQYYRVLLLIEVGDLLKAYKIAKRYPKYKPLRDLRNKLKKDINIIYKDITHEIGSNILNGNLKEAFNLVGNISSSLHNVSLNDVESILKEDEDLNIVKEEPIENNLVEEKLEIKTKPNEEIKINQSKEEVKEIEVNESREQIEPKEEIKEVLLDENNNIECSILLTKLYLDTLVIDDITISNLSTFQKTILMIGYYERHNKKLGISYIKNQKRLFSEDKNRLKILNYLDARIKNSRISSFEILTYQKYLGNGYVIPYDEFEKQESSKEVIQNIEDTKEEVIQNNKLDIEEKEEISKIDKMENSILITKLYLDSITLNDINISNLNDFDKIILTIAYYERHNKKLGLEYIKTQKNKYIKGMNEYKVLSTLEDRLKNKHIYTFDITIYQHLLKNANILYDKLDNYRTKEEVILPKTQEIEEVKEMKQQKEEQITPKKEIKYVTSLIAPSTKNKSSKNISKPREKEVITIREFLQTEIDDLGSYIYFRMNSATSIKEQKKAIKAYDILDNLSYKPITDEESLSKVKRILELYSETKKNTKPKTYYLKK